MHLGHYIKLLDHSQQTLTTAFREIGAAHSDEPDVRIDCERFAAHVEQHTAQLTPAIDKYRGDTDSEPEQLLSTLFRGPRTGPLGLLRDLHDLYLLATECDIAWTLIEQGAKGARDPQLIGVADACHPDVTVQLAWLRSRMKQAAPQALVVAT
jgi:hypothetical protein